MTISRTVPMPPGATMKASEAIANWCRRVKNVRCRNAWATKALTSCSKGSSTRMPMDRACSGAVDAPSLAACIRPGPPPVTMSQPMAASIAAARLVSS